jgi:hypothetical protein
MSITEKAATNADPDFMDPYTRVHPAVGLLDSFVIPEAILRCFSKKFSNRGDFYIFLQLAKLIKLYWKNVTKPEKSADSSKS